MSHPEVRFRRLRSDALPPRYMSDGAAGMDLAAALDATVVVPPGARVAVSTGLAIEIPVGFEGQVRPRSGLARKHGLTVLNAPGTIDADYRGEVLVLLINHGPEPVPIAPGDRIAQLIIAPVARAVAVEVAGLSGSGRGAGGFGSTGA